MFSTAWVSAVTLFSVCLSLGFVCAQSFFFSQKSGWCHRVRLGAAGMRALQWGTAVRFDECSHVGLVDDRQKANSSFSAVISPCACIILPVQWPVWTSAGTGSAYGLTLHFVPPTACQPSKAQAQPRGCDAGPREGSSDHSRDNTFLQGTRDTVDNKNQSVGSSQQVHVDQAVKGKLAGFNSCHSQLLKQIFWNWWYSA